MPNGPIDHLNADLECSLWKADTLFVSVASNVTARTERRQGLERDGGDKWREETESALLVERRAGRSQRRLFSCHIISERAVNNGPLRPPGPLHSRMQVGARLNPPLGSTAVNNADIVRHPVLSLGPGRRLLNWLYSPRAK